MQNFKTRSSYVGLRRKRPFIIKWLGVLIFAIITGVYSYAQDNILVIEGSTPKLFVSHKVNAKENFYSIGRMYNVPPKDLASYNNLQFENGLTVGEAIKIPLNANNFSQSEAASASETLIPVYHTVQAKEGLYRVSLNYNKVPIPILKRWNHIQSDAVSIGSPLVVGYLKVVKGESPLAGQRVDNTRVVADKPALKPEPVKSEPVKPEVVPGKIPASNQDVNKQERKDIQETDEHKVTVTTVHTKSSINFSGGYFKKLYSDLSENKTPVSENGIAGIFKSTSGWQDGKYYCFNNEATPGTVIRITVNATGKSVYAKVLDAIPDIKQNTDLTLILSNAAAEELGASEEKFNCALSYVK